MRRSRDLYPLRISGLIEVCSGLENLSFYCVAPLFFAAIPRTSRISPRTARAHIPLPWAVSAGRPGTEELDWIAVCALSVPASALKIPERRIPGPEPRGEHDRDDGGFAEARRHVDQEVFDLQKPVRIASGGEEFLRPRRIVRVGLPRGIPAERVLMEPVRPGRGCFKNLTEIKHQPVYRA